MGFRIDTSEFDEDVLSVIKATNQRFAQAAEVVAEEIIARAQTNAPKRFGTLQGSSFVEPATVGRAGEVSVEFGFSADHAAVMDKGFKVSHIVPVRAKALFIPLSRRAARAGAGGPVGGRGDLVEGVDYVIRRRVRTPSLRSGPGKGPNRFFSDAVENDPRFAEDVLEKAARAALDRLQP